MYEQRIKTLEESYKVIEQKIANNNNASVLKIKQSG